MSTSQTQNAKRREGGASRSRSVNAKAGGEEIAKRRARVISPDDNDDVPMRAGPSVSLSDVAGPSGVRIREEVTLVDPIRVVRRPDRSEEGEDPIDVEAAEITCGSDTEREEGRKDREADTEPLDEEMSPPAKISRKRKLGKGRPPKDPSHLGMPWAEEVGERAKAKKKDIAEEEEERALDPATELSPSRRLLRVREEEQELLLEFKEISAAGLASIVNDHVTTLRRVAQRCKNLNGTTIKSLWDTTTGIAAATAALNIRAKNSGTAVAPKEWDDMREEMRQLRADLMHIKGTADAQKEELRQERLVRRRLERELERERRRKGKSPEPSAALRPRPRPSPGRMRESEEDEGMELEEFPAGGVEDFPSPPSTQEEGVPDFSHLRPRLGEVIPAVRRPPLRGVAAVIEEDKPFAGPRLPPDQRGLEGAIADPIAVALEQMLPRLLERMGVSRRPLKGALPPNPYPGTTPRREHAGTGGKGAGRPGGPQEPSAAAVTTKSQAAASSGAKGPVAGAAGLSGRVPANASGGKKRRARGGKRNKQRKGAEPGGGKPPVKSAPAEGKPAPAVANIPAPVSKGETWTQVVGWRAKRAGGGANGAQEAAMTPTAPKKTNSGAKQQTGGAINQPAAAAGKVKRLRNPRSAAVSLTCPEGKYAEVLGEAKSKIALKDLGIEAVKNRRAVTDALLLEVSGPDGEKGADLLAQRLREVFAGRDGVRVDRPSKKAEFRLRDLDDATRPEDVAQAVAEISGCDAAAVKVGAPFTPNRGLAMVRVEAPVAAVKACVMATRIRVGWAMCRVELLDSRPLICYRCLEEGHTRQKCRSQTDRSGICYKCGGVGHNARDCTGQLTCPVCSSGDMKEVHRLGGAACVAAQQKRRKGGKRKVGEARAPATAPSTSASRPKEGKPVLPAKVAAAPTLKRKGEVEVPRVQRPRKEKEEGSIEKVETPPPVSQIGLPEVEMEEDATPKESEGTGAMRSSSSDPDGVRLEGVRDRP